MPHDKSRELRFGLVLYGGVSLAIYINGVVNEFLRMVRRDGVYKLIEWLTDTKLIVDIVSGTSAGGINGVFFAHALVNRLDFGEMERLGRQQRRYRSPAPPGR
jgi:predicted acylesterase/phospholipase RssA